MRLKLVYSQRTGGRWDTNFIRALRPIEPLMIHQAAQRARAMRRSFFRGETVDMTWGGKRSAKKGKEEVFMDRE